MNTLVLLLVCTALLACGYLFYGRWLCKQWGVDETNSIPTPAHTMTDGMDYVPAKPQVLMGHHFSSIAGAGPITGPIAAAMFGWLPVTLWVLVGGIFFGGPYDFGALVASIRNKGQSLGELIDVNISRRGKILFTAFVYLTIVLVIAAFSAIVSGTFGAVVKDGAIDVAASSTQASVAMVSILFLVVAVVYGFLFYHRRVSGWLSAAMAIGAIILCLAVGMNWHPIYMPASTWMYVVGVYIAIASVTPVWILLQPRDYLSSFLLYAMIILAFVGIVGAHPDINPEKFPAFTGFAVETKNGIQYLFPILFTTVACGAISGFHAIVSSGTTSKQLDKESHARPIAYGSMLLECVMAIITICAIAYAREIGHTKGVTDIFAGGIAAMVAAVPGLSGFETIIYTLLVLTYSAFCLTSLDTCARVGRFMFQEFWLEPGQTVHDIKDGWKSIMVNPFFATIMTVIPGIALGMNGFQKVWGIFGTANQLLAGLGLLALAAWLTNAGKNNKMFRYPMIFMIIVTISSLLIIIRNQIMIIAAGGADWGPYAQVVIGCLLTVMAVFLVIEGVGIISGKKKHPIIED